MPAATRVRIPGSVDRPPTEPRRHGAMIDQPPTPQRVVEVVTDAGEVAGHRLVLLSLEIYDAWMDLRFARIDVGAERPLPRRVPAPEGWRVHGADGDYTVVDAVGRGDRGFSNGEVRIVPAVPAHGDTLEVTAVLLDGEPPLGATITVPPAG